MARTFFIMDSASGASQPSDWLDRGELQYEYITAMDYLHELCGKTPPSFVLDAQPGEDYLDRARVDGYYRMLGILKENGERLTVKEFKEEFERQWITDHQLEQPTSKTK